MHVTIRINGTTHGTWKVFTKPEHSEGRAVGKASGTWFRGQNIVVKYANNNSDLSDNELMNMLSQSDFSNTGKLTIGEWRKNDLVTWHETN